MALESSLLEARLRSVEGKGYGAYETIRGEWDFSTFTLFVDHVQSDPFASPSRLRVRVSQEVAGFPASLLATKTRRVALADLLTRGFALAIRRHTEGRRGTGRSGLVRVDVGGQEVLERTSCLATADFIELRFAVGLPAAGRRCLGREAADVFFAEIPKLVSASLLYQAWDPKLVSRHLAVAEDAEALRGQLAPRGLVAFVADGAVLPRESGVSEKPLRGPGVVPFALPSELRVELEAPHRGKVGGMGIPQGVTLLVGGGYHGKSTLLSAIARGVYNHVPGDGREYVVTVADAVKIRAEDGRRVERVNIIPFVSNLPFGQDTRAFSTENASGSTSQAANIVEALEAGTSLLLMDEDTCATNFMIRDSRMQRLVPKEKEPITPLVDQVRHLYQEHGVSSLIVMGGSSDYFEVADTIITLDHYRPHVVTGRARQIVAEMPSRRQAEGGSGFGPVVSRVPDPASVDHYRRGRVKVRATDVETIRFGEETMELYALEQLVEPSQTRAIGDILVYAVKRGYLDGRRPLVEAIALVFADIDQAGLDIISPFYGQHPGDYARPRPQEVAAALNRLRTLKVSMAR